jgi:nitrite reductase/ring-hydroxylating ferredoxin subunit
MRQAPYQSYVLALRVHDELPDALYWDDEQPYHYIRLADSNDPHLLIVGGADHKTGQADERQQFDRLAEYAAQRFRIQSVEQRWSAELFEPSDGVPFIGRVPRSEHLYLGTGYSGTGLTYGTAAGMLLSDLLLGRASPDAEVFSPSRFKLWAAAPGLLSENLDVARRYIADRFGAEKLDSLEKVPVGEGRRVDYEGDACAIYREESGQIRVLSAVCPHAGCHVQWNSAEKTWDCPCHGSRFAATGERLYGPASADLEQKKTVVPVHID